MIMPLCQIIDAEASRTSQRNMLLAQHLSRMESQSSYVKDPIFTVLRSQTTVMQDESIQRLKALLQSALEILVEGSERGSCTASALRRSPS